MSITARPDASNLSLPLPLYETVAIADQTSPGGTEFTILAGLDELMVAQLRAYSLDATDEALHVTSDRQRFGEGSYADWYAKNRVPFGLIHNATGALAALAWYGPKPIGRKPMKHLSSAESQQDERTLDAGNWATFVYRSYHPYRGTGLMKEFVQFTLQTYAAAIPGVRFWGGIDANNSASMHLSLALGFTLDEAASDREHGWLVVTD